MVSSVLESSDISELKSVLTWCTRTSYHSLYEYRMKSIEYHDAVKLASPRRRGRIYPRFLRDHCTDTGCDRLVNTIVTLVDDGIQGASTFNVRGTYYVILRGDAYLISFGTVLFKTKSDARN